MVKFTHGCRILLGAIFILVDLNLLLGFFAMPSPSADGAAFMGALQDTGYFMPVLKLTELLAGGMLVVNMFPALALILLAPIIVQIFLFHLFLDLAGLPLAIFLVVLEVFLAYQYREQFLALLMPRQLPHGTAQAKEVGRHIRLAHSQDYFRSGT